MKAITQNAMAGTPILSALAAASAAQQAEAAALEAEAAAAAAAAAADADDKRRAERATVDSSDEVCTCWLCSLVSNIER